MKKIYCIRHAKSKDYAEGESDFERSISKKGYRDIRTIGSYLRLRGISPQKVLSSCALRAQESALKLMERVGYEGSIEYLEELYLRSPEEIIEIIKMQDDAYESLFIVGHHPYLTELVNRVSQEHIAKIPSMGVVCIVFETEIWQDIAVHRGEIEFFITPKQFKYYMPQQIRAALAK